MAQDSSAEIIRFKSPNHIEKVKTNDFILEWCSGKWKENGGYCNLYLTLTNAADNSANLTKKMDGVVAALLDILESNWIEEDTMRGMYMPLDHFKVRVINESSPRYSMGFARHMRNLSGAVFADALKAHCLDDTDVIDKMFEVSIEVCFNENMYDGEDDDDVWYGPWSSWLPRPLEYDDGKDMPPLFGKK